MATNLAGDRRDGDTRGRIPQWSTWWQACWRSDGLDNLAWAAIFIWGALVLLAEGAGAESRFGWWNGWGVFLAGAGAIVLLGGAIRSLRRQYGAAWWDLVIGVVLLSIAFDWNGWYWVWALVLAAIGVAILRKAFPRLNRPD